MQGRIFDQSVGRFMQPDPVVQAPFNSQGLNRYSYALNSPLNFVDPSGFEWYESKGTVFFTDDPLHAQPPSQGGGQQSTAQGPDNRGRPDSNSSAPTENSANGGGGDPTGGDKSNQGRPDGNPSNGPGLAENGRAQSAQAEQGAGRNGDFFPGKPQADAAIPQELIPDSSLPGAEPPGSDRATIEDRLADGSALTGSLGIAASLGQYSNVQSGFWRGANGKWNSLNWGGNKYTGGGGLL